MKWKLKTPTATALTYDQGLKIHLISLQKALNCLTLEDFFFLKKAAVFCFHSICSYSNEFQIKNYFFSNRCFNEFQQNK